MVSKSTCNWLAGLSIANAGLQCTNQLITDNKANDPNALSKFVFNLSGAAMRIGVADYAAREYNNIWPYSVNSWFPYTNPQSNNTALMAETFSMPFSWGWGMPMGGWNWGWGGGGHHHCHCGSTTKIFIRC